MTYKNKTITKHARGNWFVRVRYNGAYISIYGRTKLEAYEKLKVIADKIEQEKLMRLFEKVSPPTPQQTAPIISGAKAVKTYTLQEWFDEWLHSYKIGSVRACTLDGFKKQFKYLKNLYAVNITDITNLMLSKAINEVTALRTKDGLHNMIKQLFAVAFNNRLIESNPALTLPRPKQFAKNEKKAFTQDQENRFIEICMQDPDTYAPFLVCLLQGVRRGEMLALRPNDFDFEKNVLRIDESYDDNHQEDLQTKNEASNRKMPMFELTKQILLRFKDCSPNERIFTLSHNGLNKRLDKLYKANPDLPRLTMHELRHTFISRCHEKGIDEIIVQKWVGHAVGSRMTKAVYTHIGNDAEQRYIELLNAK
jgi:integrase